MGRPWVMRGQSAAWRCAAEAFCATIALVIWLAKVTADPKWTPKKYSNVFGICCPMIRILLSTSASVRYAVMESVSAQTWNLDISVPNLRLAWLARECILVLGFLENPIFTRPFLISTTYTHPLKNRGMTLNRRLFVFVMLRPFLPVLARSGATHQGTSLFVLPTYLLLIR